MVDFTIQYSATQISLVRSEGPFALQMSENGGLITQAKLTTGFVRRGIESCITKLNFLQGIHYCDRLDYLSAPSGSLAYAMAIERLGRVEVPERAHFVRVLLLELSRIMSHLMNLSQVARDMGADNIAKLVLRERELYCDLFELYCGSRLGFGSIKIGGVLDGASEGFLFQVEKTIASTESFLSEIEAPFIANAFLLSRLEGIGFISKEDVHQFGLTGPVARASGVDMDVRWSVPYAAYADLKKEDVFLDCSMGDALARLTHRVAEMRSSVRLIRDCLLKMPTGNHCNAIGIDFRLEAASIDLAVETPRGKLSLQMRSNGSDKPATIRFTPPSSKHLAYLEGLLVDERLEDVFLVLGSLDLSFSEVDG